MVMEKSVCEHQIWIAELCVLNINFVSAVTYCFNSMSGEVISFVFLFCNCKCCLLIVVGIFKSTL